MGNPRPTGGPEDAAQRRGSGLEASLVPTLTQALRRHVMQAWFPRCVDHEQGGYLCDFDWQWRAEGSQMRMLEFQARQARAAARLALAFPAEAEWAEYAGHGFRYLRDVMWDGQGGGGWFWLVDRVGRPAAGATKHAHAGAYAVQACALVYAATGDPSAKRLAEQGLGWFERHARDKVHGGFHSWFLRDGTVISRAEQVPRGVAAIDPLGHAIGLKSTNVQGDWFEALLELREVGIAPSVGERLAELARIYLDHLSSPSGTVRAISAADWSPQQVPRQFGFSFQAVHRMLAAAEYFPDLPLVERAVAILADAVRKAGHPDGGFRLEEPTGGWRRFHPAQYGARARRWWIQFEALRALTAVAAIPGPEQDRMARQRDLQWQFMRDHLFDERHGGIHEIVPTDVPPWARRWGPVAREGKKGHRWKDASHETDAMVACVHLLSPRSKQS